MNVRSKNKKSLIAKASTVYQWLISAKTKIDPLDTELILQNVLHFSDRAELILHAERQLTITEQLKADQFLQNRLAGQPLAYILNNKEFYGRNFYIDENVLIPRPESEDIIDLANGLRGVFSTAFRRPIIDVGTGSGTLAITLALETGASLLALDNSPAALRVARRNAKALHAKNITFQRSDLLLALSPSECQKSPQPQNKPTANLSKWRSADLLVANLPYVDRSWDFLSPELSFEPATALYAADHGLALIRQLFDQLSAGYAHPHFLILEADPCQHAAVKKLATTHHFHHLKTLNYQLLFQNQN